ncbi:MAG: hypothetical protein WDW36_007939 [Sanguina aurantia]
MQHRMDGVILPAAFFYTAHRYSAFLEAACYAGNTTGGTVYNAGGLDHPCGDTGLISRSAVLLKQLLPTWNSHAAATHHTTTMYPNEAWILSAMAVIAAWVCCLIALPSQRYLDARSWLWMLVSLGSSGIRFSRLLTHPHAPFSSDWLHLPMLGIVLPCEQMIFKLEGLPAYIHIAGFTLLNLLSIILLPTVFPDLPVPAHTLPILFAGAWVSLRLASSPAHSPSASLSEGLHTLAEAAQEVCSRIQGLWSCEPSVHGLADASQEGWPGPKGLPCRLGLQEGCPCKPSEQRPASAVPVCVLATAEPPVTQRKRSDREPSESSLRASAATRSLSGAEALAAVFARGAVDVAESDAAAALSRGGGRGGSVSWSGGSGSSSGGGGGSGRSGDGSGSSSTGGLS